MDEEAPDLKVSRAFKIKINLAPATLVGKVPSGNRVFVAVTGGSLVGSGINAKVLHGGDWILLGDDGYGKLDVRLHYETDDGAIFHAAYSGHIQVTPEGTAVLNQLPEAKSTKFTDQYFMAPVSLETASPKYAWINRTTFVTKGRLQVDPDNTYHVVYQVYKLE